jgi:hypothetical protein
MTQDAVPNDNSSESPTSIQLHYIKSNFFRVIHLDGTFGGVSPRGNIHMAIFNDRQPIPRMIEHEITSDGRLGEELSRDIRSGIVREVEADVIMDLNAARSLREWLTGKITDLEERLQAEQSSDAKEQV